MSTSQCECEQLWFRGWAHALQLTVPSWINSPPEPKARCILSFKVLICTILFVWLCFHFWCLAVITALGCLFSQHLHIHHHILLYATMAPERRRYVHIFSGASNSVGATWGRLMSGGETLQCFYSCDIFFFGFSVCFFMLTAHFFCYIDSKQQ